MVHLPSSDRFQVSAKELFTGKIFSFSMDRHKVPSKNLMMEIEDFIRLRDKVENNCINLSRDISDLRNMVVEVADFISLREKVENNCIKLQELKHQRSACVNDADPVSNGNVNMVLDVEEPDLESGKTLCNSFYKM